MGSKSYPAKGAFAVGAGRHERYGARKDRLDHSIATRLECGGAKTATTSCVF